MPEDGTWYELAELAELWEVPLARVRSAVANLENLGVIEVRDRPRDKRYKQVNKNSIDKLRLAVLGS
jgi:hypothetical protein